MAKGKGRKKSKKARPDYVEFGSDEHRDHIGLRKAEPADEITFEGFALVDPTQFGLTATKTALMTVLRQRVGELRSGGPPKPQSKDENKPNFLKPMWKPDEEPAVGLVV